MDKAASFRSENRGRINLRGDEEGHEVAEALAQAWDDGFTSVQLDNYSGPTGPTSILAMKNPAQLRLPWAKFDPKKKNSRDLLAGLSGASIGAGALTLPDNDRQ
jgi:hypothetical protein